MRSLGTLWVVRVSVERRSSTSMNTPRPMHLSTEPPLLPPPNAHCTGCIWWPTTLALGGRKGRTNKLPASHDGGHRQAAPRCLRTKTSDLRTGYGLRSRRNTVGWLSGCQAGTIVAFPFPPSAAAHGRCSVSADGTTLWLPARIQLEPLVSRRPRGQGEVSGSVRPWVSGQARSSSPEVARARSTRPMPRDLLLWAEEGLPPQRFLYGSANRGPSHAGRPGKPCKLQALVGHVGGRKTRLVCPKFATACSTLR